MKIFAVLRNYVHEQTKDSPFGEGSVCWYEMADSSILRSGNPWFVPDFDDTFMAFPSVAYRIGRLGKGIAPRFASRYIEAAAPAFAIVATTILADARKHGLPWCKAVSFDRSCMLGNLTPIDTFNKNKVIEITCGDAHFSYHIDNLLLPVEDVISLLSRDNTLKNGDLILAGVTPTGMALTPDVKLTARFDSLNTNLLDINIK